MRRLLSSGLAFIFLAWTSGSSGVAAWREPPTTPPADSPSSTTPAPNDDPGTPVSNAALTRSGPGTGPGPWRSTASALEQWPSRVEFSRRLRLCEIHFKLIRRYADTSFRHVLLPLPQEQATTLYDEVARAYRESLC